MAVRAKFIVNTITKALDYNKREVHTIKLYPVANDDTAENKQFWQYTPAGSIELTTVNPSAVAEFASALGQAVYVDFTPAEQ